MSRGQYTCHPSPEDEVGVEVAAEVVDGEVLAVQAHVGEEVELVAVVVEDEELLLLPRLGAARQLLQTPLLVLVPAQDHVGLGLDTHELEYFRVKQVYNNNIQNYITVATINRNVLDLQKLSIMHFWESCRVEIGHTQTIITRFTEEYWPIYHDGAAGYTSECHTYDFTDLDGSGRSFLLSQSDALNTIAS